MKLTREAYAKINLFLAVTDREANGYHTVENIMQTVSLSDTVTLRTGSDIKGISVLSSDDELGSEDDLVYRAAKMYFAFADEKAKKNADPDKVTYRNDDAPLCVGHSPHRGSSAADGVSFTVTKRIPKAAGLGGGSSDAAAALLLLNEAFGFLDGDELRRSAERLGADVPFFLVNGAVLCTHYGEIITPLTAGLVDCEILIVKPGNKGSTAEMYSVLDSKSRHPNAASADKMITALEKGRLSYISAAIRNDFSQVWQNTETERAVDIMIESGAAAASVSGSGPSAYGLFANKADAKAAKERLAAAGHESFLCKPISAGTTVSR